MRPIYEEEDEEDPVQRGESNLGAPSGGGGTCVGGEVSGPHSDRCVHPLSLCRGGTRELSRGACRKGILRRNNRDEYLSRGLVLLIHYCLLAADGAF